MPDFRLRTKVLLTRSPLYDLLAEIVSFDLHALSTPPAFILSQDQTLKIRKEMQFIKPIFDRAELGLAPLSGATQST